MRRASLNLVLCTTLATALVAGCGGDPEPKATPTPGPTLSPSASPPPRPEPKDPLTGLAPVKGPVVAVKIDNGALARPYHRGLGQAAVVYQELVEGGATRFMAVFESAAATSEVGPIRSARESDLDILRAYGRASLAYSGAQPGVQRIISSAARAGRVIDASYDAVPSLYRLGERRRDARNFFAVPARLGARKGGSEPRDIGFRFGPVGPATATAAARVAFSPKSSVSLRYDGRNLRYVVTQGSRAVPFTPANVIVQFVPVRRSRFFDVNGMNSPYTVTTGSGRAVVLRDGRRVATTWKRAKFGPTRFLAAGGKDVLLRPGSTLVLLVPTTGSIRYA